MKHRCFLDSCKELPEILCKCQGEYEAMCSKHFQNHYQNNQNKFHNLIPAFKTINSDLIGAAIEYFKSLIKKNNEMKSIVLQETEKILKISNELVKSIEKLNRFNVFNMNQVLKRNRVMIPLIDRFNIMNTESQAIKNIEELQEIETINDLKIIDFQQTFESCCKKISGLKNCTHESESNSDKDVLYFFKSNTKTLFRFYSNSEALESFTVNSVNTQGILSSICKIDKLNLFVYGGHPTSMTSTVIINTSNYSIEQLPQGIDSCAASAQYYNKKVYVFGGYCDKGILLQSRYFDLIKKSWFSIAQLPSNCRDTSTLLFDDEILISSFQNNIFTYNIPNNQYLILNAGVLIPNANILIFYSNKILLLTNPNFYICDDYKEKKNWRLVHSRLSFETTSSKPCLNGRYAYFSTYVNKIYRFDCETETLNMIKQV